MRPLNYRSRRPGEEVPTRYSLLALDVDGTLVGPDSAVDQEIALAVRQACRSGLRVCLATGRSYIETVDIWRRLELPEPYLPLILIGGALVSEPDTARTLYQRVIPPELAREFADALNAAGHAAMAIVDAWRWGFDYYLADPDGDDLADRLWFSKMTVEVRRVSALAEADPAHPILRISALAEGQAGEALAEKLTQRFGGRLNVHRILAPNYGVTIVEAFAKGAEKFSALRYVAQARRVPRSRIVAVGDDVNDIEMIRRAGLGVAMPQSPPAVRQVADRVAEEGLAEFIRRLGAGEFG